MKFGVPRPVTYATRDKRSRKRREEGLAGRTGSHPTSAENPLLLAPGFLPSLMSVKPDKPIPYSQGLTQPNGLMPCESRLSLSNEKMAAAVCSSELSQVLKDWQIRAKNEGKTHACRADRTVHIFLFQIVDESVFDRLRGNVGDATALRPVAAVVLIAQPPDIGIRITDLIFVDVKVIREAAPGEVARDFDGNSCRTADTSDIGTCEINYDDPVSDLYVYLCTAHKEGLKATYRTQGN